MYVYIYIYINPASTQNFPPTHYTNLSSSQLNIRVKWTSHTIHLHYVSTFPPSKFQSQTHLPFPPSPPLPSAKTPSIAQLPLKSHHASPPSSLLPQFSLPSIPPIPPALHGIYISLSLDLENSTSSGDSSVVEQRAAV